MTSGQEAHVGHVVGLVEDGDLRRRDSSTAPRSMRSVRRPGVATRRSTPRLSAAIWWCSEAADDELVAQAHDVHERLQRVGHLHGQLAGGHEDQGARTTRRGAGASGEAGDHREAEGQRLAGAGPAASEHVAAGEGVGDRGGLDRERLGDAVAGQSLDEPLGQAECGGSRCPRSPPWPHPCARSSGSRRRPRRAAPPPPRSSAGGRRRRGRRRGSHRGRRDPGSRRRCPGRHASGPGSRRRCHGRCDPGSRRRCHGRCDPGSRRRCPGRHASGPGSRRRCPGRRDPGDPVVPRSLRPW